MHCTMIVVINRGGEDDTGMTRVEVEVCSRSRGGASPMRADDQSKEDGRIVRGRVERTLECRVCGIKRREKDVVMERGVGVKEEALSESMSRGWFEEDEDDKKSGKDGLFN
ncbi:hypothetical protein Tco_0586638 [Tanacetum coccineum]